MLKIVELDSWSDFEKVIARSLLEETQELMGGPSFFRGHSDADWHLETTLERHMGTNRPVGYYFQSIEKIQSEIETFTDRNWDLSISSLEDYFSSLKNSVTFKFHPVNAYMQYLRHFGYPSPLLDWTFSPFVAAYFAFRDTANKAKSVAIYELLAASDMGLLPISEEGNIYPIHATARKNKRHYLQQSVYTICLRKINNIVCYVGHEGPHLFGDEIRSGEPLTKYVLPASERITALHSLQAYNINAYSLFGTEESLLETLFLRDYKSREIEKRIFGDQR